jgi:cytochrome c oxidase assembly protein subunit 11
MSSDEKQGNIATGKLVVRLLVVAVAMFGFGVFAMPPLYQTFCEITGIGQAGVKIEDAAPVDVLQDRTVKIRFDATTNSQLNWEFRPVDRSMDVQVGAPAEALYFAANNEQQAVAGMATFNVSPPVAARYFVKVECFCFTRQVLAAGESREMPVYFFIQPDIPADITEMTLSYTFFKNDQEEVAQVAP